MSLQDTVHVRPATFRDYRGVMDINQNVDDGHDYLPMYYHQYVQSPDVHCFIAEIKGNIVGFAALRVLDGGQTLLSVAGRTKADMNRQGIYMLLVYKSVSLVQRGLPSVTMVRHAGLSGRHFESIPEMRKEGTAVERVLMKSKFLAFTGSTSMLKGSVMTFDPDDRSCVLPLDEAMAVFDDVTNLVCLFPSGYFLAHQNARPLQATLQTSQDVLRSHHAVVSFRKNSTQKLSAISLSHCCHTPKGLRLDVHYYDVTPDADVITSHVTRHFRRLRAVAPSSGEYQVLLHVPLWWDLVVLREAVGGVVKEVGGQEVAFPNQVYVVAEGPVNRPHVLTVPLRSKV